MSTPIFEAQWKVNIIDLMLEMYSQVTTGTAEAGFIIGMKLSQDILQKITNRALELQDKELLLLLERLDLVKRK